MGVSFHRRLHVCYSSFIRSNPPPPLFFDYEITEDSKLSQRILPFPPPSKLILPILPLMRIRLIYEFIFLITFNSLITFFFVAYFVLPEIWYVIKVKIKLQWPEIGLKCFKKNG
jgi:hypothetical protein